jgi:hypothetical protein
MESVEISCEGVLRSNQISFIISSDIYNINRNMINNELFMILLSVGCENIDEYYKKLKNVLNESSYSYNKSSYNKVITIFQKIFCMDILNKPIFDKVFYLPSFIDNRGRQYYSSLLSPTFYVLFRYMYKFEVDKDFVGLENSVFYKKISKHLHLVESFKLSSKGSYILIILLIEVGKFFIKTEGKHIITTESIIDTGLCNFKKKNFSKDFDNDLYINKLYYLITKLLSDKAIDPNTLIFKDATASGIQNFGIILGYKKDKLQYLNMDGDNYCDTYQYLINKYLKDESGKMYDRNL